MNLSCYKTPYKYGLKRSRKHNLNRFMWSYYAALIYYQSGENLNYTVYIYIYVYVYILTRWSWWTRGSFEYSSCKWFPVQRRCYTSVASITLVTLPRITLLQLMNVLEGD